MDCDIVSAIETILDSKLGNSIPPETIRSVLEHVRFLESRQTELQERNTNLVVENRELQKKLQEKTATINHCLEIIKELKS